MMTDIKPENKPIDFGNWVPLKMIVVPAILGLACLGAGLRWWPLLIPAALFCAIAVYFAVARWLFSARGGNVQDRILELLLEHLPADAVGKVLDIGCGNGALAIKAAQRFPKAAVTGVDFWGKSWDYSIKVCEGNAAACGLSGRVDFRQGSAASLPFADGSFDLVISNLVFHEVRDAADKREPLREALRVLKPGGVFVLQDLFLLEPYFGTPQELQDTLRGWGAGRVEFIRTCDREFIPKWVKLPFMVGTLAILRGER
ncbi:MAG: class I SAM-dependent methyltransferase [Anaerolineae bacterium]|nr:class I SAM-dependent methyltransferase [Anaerolineae bacterium]